MVQEFTQAAGETTESFTTDDGNGSGPRTQTRQSVSAGESEGGRPQHSYGDMVRLDKLQWHLMRRPGPIFETSPDSHLS